MLSIPSDRRKQSQRDKFAHTYVVRANAPPAGPARIVFRNYYIMGMSFVFQDISSKCSRGTSNGANARFVMRWRTTSMSAS
jgi:hypothetical protein